MKPRSPVLTFAMTLATVTMAACSKSSGSSADASPPARVDGAVACPEAGTGNILMSQVPQGLPCQTDAPVCSFAADGLCGDADINSIVNGWECACNAGKWDCVITSQGGGICMPFGPTCGYTLPKFGLTASCYDCCEPDEGMQSCFNGQCSSYVGCYCNCAAKDSSCIAACAPSADVPECASCFTQLRACGTGKCASECKGQVFPDVGEATSDASTPTDATSDAQGS